MYPHPHLPSPAPWLCVVHANAVQDLQLDISLGGMIIAAISVVSSGLQQIFVRTMQQKHKLTAHELLSNTAPAQAGWGAGLWGRVWKAAGMWQPGLRQPAASGLNPRTATSVNLTPYTAALAPLHRRGRCCWWAPSWTSWPQPNGSSGTPLLAVSWEWRGRLGPGHKCGAVY